MQKLRKREKKKKRGRERPRQIYEIVLGGLIAGNSVGSMEAHIYIYH